jgi:chromosome segregation ATPase
MNEEKKSNLQKLIDDLSRQYKAASNRFNTTKLVGFFRLYPEITPTNSLKTKFKKLELDSEKLSVDISLKLKKRNRHLEFNLDDLHTGLDNLNDLKNEIQSIMNKNRRLELDLKKRENNLFNSINELELELKQTNHRMLLMKDKCVDVKIKNLVYESDIPEVEKKKIQQDSNYQMIRGKNYISFTGSLMDVESFVKASLCLIRLCSTGENRMATLISNTILDSLNVAYHRYIMSITNAALYGENYFE